MLTVVASDVWVSPTSISCRSSPHTVVSSTNLSNNVLGADMSDRVLRWLLQCMLNVACAVCLPTCLCISHRKSSFASRAPNRGVALSRRIVGPKTGRSFQPSDFVLGKSFQSPLLITFIKLELSSWRRDQSGSAVDASKSEVHWDHYRFRIRTGDIWLELLAFLSEKHLENHLAPAATAMAANSGQRLCLRTFFDVVATKKRCC